MRNAIAILVLLGALSALAAGCTQKEEPLRYRAQNVQHVLLYDVRTSGQGGYNVFVNRRGDAWVQVVRPASAYFDEQRYAFKIDQDRLEALLAAASDPELIDLAQRRTPAGPDGSTATIEIALDSGESISIKRRPDSGELRPFDATYLLLRQAGEESPRTDPIYEGRFRWGWRPEGFEIPPTQPEP